jgi:hypothetical protein
VVQARPGLVQDRERLLHQLLGTLCLRGVSAGTAAGRIAQLEAGRIEVRDQLPDGPKAFGSGAFPGRQLRGELHVLVEDAPRDLRAAEDLGRTDPPHFPARRWIPTGSVPAAIRALDNAVTRRSIDW